MNYLKYYSAASRSVELVLLCNRVLQCTTVHYSTTVLQYYSTSTFNATIQANTRQDEHGNAPAEIRCFPRVILNILRHSTNFPRNVSTRAKLRILLRVLIGDHFHVYHYNCLKRSLNASRPSVAELTYHKNSPLGCRGNIKITCTQQNTAVECQYPVG